jgi:hypothetical protein
MTNMFRNAVSFKRDLSVWEVPLVKGVPEDFAANSPLISPKWITVEKEEKESFSWVYILLAVSLIPLLVYVIRQNIKRSDTALPIEKNDYETLRTFLMQKNTDQLSRVELDEILGITQKTVESQKRARSNFIKGFNSSGQGEIIRIRDEFDSRSFNYQVNWKKEK